MILSNITISDIITYEKSNNISIIKELNDMSIFIIIDLLKIEYKTYNEEFLINKYNELLDNCDIITLCSNLILDLFGISDLDISNNNNKTNKNKSNKSKKHDKDAFDINKNTISEYYLNLYINIHNFDKNLDISKYLDMTPSLVNSFVSTINKNIVDIQNNKMQEMYLNAQLTAGVMFGGLKKCPSVSSNDIHYEDDKIQIEDFYNNL